MMGMINDVDLIPHIMVLDRDPEDQSDVLNIDIQEHTMILSALEDVTISIFGQDFPCGTLRMKEGQAIMFPLFTLMEEIA